MSALSTLTDHVDATAPGIWRYRRLMRLNESIEPVSLGEGNTPLIPLQTTQLLAGAGTVLVKNESVNPTWSHKDRLATVGISVARHQGATTVAVSSTGNQGAAAAAYSARAGLDCVVFTLQDVPEMMKTLMQSYGAYLVALPTAKDRLTLMAECVRDRGWFPFSGYHLPPVGSNPAALAGYMSLAFEIFEQLHGHVPDNVVVPTSHGDTLAGMHQGFVRLVEIGAAGSVPRLIAVEPYGPLELALQGAGEPVEVTGGGETRAFSIAARMATPNGIAAVRASGGSAITMDDGSMLQAQQLLGREGLFVEPSSAMAVAAIAPLVRRGSVASTDTTIVVSTSSGLKDPGYAREWLPPVPNINPDVTELDSALGALKAGR